MSHVTLVTGSAGFIGSALCMDLLAKGELVVGIDDLNDYYDVDLKRARLARHIEHPCYTHHTIALHDRDAFGAVFDAVKPTRVVNLAAQAGVRYAAINPRAYADSNLVGFLEVLEGCRRNGVEHLVFASTSSVYGANGRMPYSEHDGANHPLSLYAATKKANEAMAHSYAHLYGIPCTGLRFFTVYGPWGRPDMAPMLFTRRILAGEPIDVFNHGQHRRDFTYVDDIVQGVAKVLARPPRGRPDWSPLAPDPATSLAPYRLYNIGNQTPVALMDFIEALESALGRTAVKRFLPLQPGDVPETHADVGDLTTDMGYRPTTPVDEGVRRLVDWYRGYYRV